MKVKDKIASINWLELVVGKVPKGFEDVLCTLYKSDKTGTLKQIISLVKDRVGEKGLLDALREIPAIVNELSASDIDIQALSDLLEVDDESS